MVELTPLEFRRATFDWRRTLLMGVVNVTPDSFSDGGSLPSTASAIAHAQQLLREGADILDLGGESTRPGALPVPVKEEAARVVPVVQALCGERQERGTVVSVDTCKAAVAAAALDAGAEIINDISGGTLDPELLQVAAQHRAAVILGHMRGTPADMNERAHYVHLVPEVVSELAARVEAAIAAGVAPSRLAIDPGLGFAKTAAHNLELLARLPELTALGLPIVIGASRKSFIGRLTGRPVGERELGTAAANSAAVLGGAQIIRVHDVAAQRDAVVVAEAIRRAVPT